MCIAVLKLPEGELTKEQLKNCFSNNKDGAGLMFACNNILHIQKGFMSFESFYKNYRNYLMKFPKAIFVLHFRTGTSGGVNAKMCHPFKTHKGIAMVHNGIIAGLGDEKKSDTCRLAEYMSSLPVRFMYDENILNLIKRAIGYSKIIILAGNGKWVIVGEERGEWNKDKTVWFSNKDYEPRKIVVYGDDYGKYFNRGIFYFRGGEEVSLQRSRPLVPLCPFCNKVLIKDVERESNCCLDCQKMYYE